MAELGFERRSVCFRSLGSVHEPSLPLIIFKGSPGLAVTVEAACKMELGGTPCSIPPPIKPFLCAVHI